MKNTLSVTTINGCVCTEFVTSDGVTSMELHRPGLNDSKVLTALLEKKFYQYYKGDWTLTFPEDQKVITKPTFVEVIDAAHAFIFNRDNSFPDYSDFC